MYKYYEILGVSQEASQSEIKRAYFKLVRQYSPEKYPEEFRQIREAYEGLKDKEETGPVFEPPKDRLAARFLAQIQEQDRRKEYAGCRESCEEAVKRFPEEIQFYYYLAVAQRMSGKTGKAIKTGEKLIKKYPDNKWFWRELALAYVERGYMKKAVPYLIKAYEMGCTDNDFLLTASVVLGEQGNNEEGIKLLLFLVKKEKRWTREDVPDLFEAFGGLVIMGERQGKIPEEMLELLLAFLKKFSMYIEENLDYLLIILNKIEVMSAICVEYAKVVKEIRKVIEEHCNSPENRELLFLSEVMYTIERMVSDARISDEVKGVAACFVGQDTEIKTFALLDMKLCMLKNRDASLKELEILEKEYPFFFKEVEDFASKLRKNKDLHLLKDSLQKRYTSLAASIEGGRYFELYPEEEEKSMGKVVYTSEELIPYTREAKIGRNSPCPCGSGKKYKKCCGK